MTVRWTRTALRDLEAVHRFVARDNPDAAATTVHRIISATDGLSRYPEMGRKGRIPGTRELILPPYVIAYRVRSDTLELLAIIHGARKWPDSL